MTSINLFIFLEIFCLISSSVASSPNYIEVNNGQCGGTIEADSGRLTYPIAEAQDELCIWTIHLKTTSTFRLSFSSFNISSNSESCEDGAVRIYSLTNLVSSDKAEGFSFCNSQPPPSTGNIYLSENLITVIYKSSRNLAHLGSEFILNWEGISIQPIEKSHESTYSSAQSGVIKYPVDGDYTPNQVSSWLVNSQAEAYNGPNPPKLALNFSYVQTGPCGRGNAEDCLCDAVILYQIDSNGQLEETSRLCGNLSNQAFPEISRNFVLGFFSDHETAAGQEKGFEVVYKPVIQPPTVNSTRTCGGVLSGSSGLIEYKTNETYNNNERCLWTIRSEGKTEITFTLHEFGLYYWYDTLEVLAMDSNGNTTEYAFRKADIEAGSKTFNATVAIVCFYTDGLSDSGSTGFSLSYQTAGETDNSLRYYRDVTIQQNKTESNGVLRYPENGQQIRNDELSTFVVQHEHNGEYEPMSINVTSLNLQRDPVTGECNDWIKLYRLHSLPGTMIKLQEISRWPWDGGICQMDELPDDDRGFPNTDYVVLVFLRTSSQGTSQGFEITWELEFD